MKEIKEYLQKRQKQYEKLGFRDYTDLEDVGEFEAPYELVDYDKYKKEVKRCQFLLETIMHIEKMLK